MPPQFIVQQTYSLKSQTRHSHCRQHPQSHGLLTDKHIAQELPTQPGIKPYWGTKETLESQHKRNGQAKYVNV